VSRRWTHRPRPHVAWKTRTERGFSTTAHIPAHVCRIERNTKSSTPALLTLPPEISRFLAGGFREDLSEGWNYVSANTGLQIEFSSSHCPWPFVCGLTVWVAPSFNHKRKAFFNYELLGLCRITVRSSHEPQT
jgi:hypothetical protein